MEKRPMRRLAIYGKGGIGKSTTASHLSAALAQKGYRVMQIGCHPKVDSTKNLMGGRRIPTVLEHLREKADDLTLEDITFGGYGGVLCAESDALPRVLAATMYLEMWCAAGLSCPFGEVTPKRCSLVFRLCLLTTSLQERRRVRKSLRNNGICKIMIWFSPYMQITSYPPLRTVN